MEITNKGLALEWATIGTYPFKRRINLLATELFF